MQGIYKIKNTINGKLYIGQSVDINSRWRAHKSSSLNSNSSDYGTPLHRAFRKYGVDNFEFSMLESNVPHNLLNEKENYFIHKYDSIKNGYNQIITSRNGLPKDKIVAVRELKYHVSKDILYTDLVEGNFESVAKKYGVSSTAIRKWCSDYGIPRYSSCYQTSIKKNNFSSKMKQIAKDSSTSKKKIAMLDKKTYKVLHVFDSLTDASKYMGTSIGNISRAISHYEGRTTSLGYRWKYL